MYGALDISTSGLIAQRTRLEAITSNIANQATPGYRAKRVFFAAGHPASAGDAGRALGVHVAAIDADPSPLNQLRYDPNDPLAEKTGPNRGYVMGSNVHSIKETTDAYQAQRAYEANIVVAEASKAMVAQALRLIA